MKTKTTNPGDKNDVYRLRDMVVPEVSFVDRGANKKKRFLVVKRNDPMDLKTDPNDATSGGEDNTDLDKQVLNISQPTKTTVLRAVTEALQRLQSVAADAKSGNKPPTSVSGEAKAIAGVLDAIGAKSPSADGGAGTNSEPSAKQAASASIPGVVAGAMEQLMTLVDALRDAEVTTEKTDTPLPPAVAAQIAGVARMLRTLAAKDPSPERKADDSKSTAGEDDVSKAKTRMARSRFDRFQTAIKTLRDVLDEISGPLPKGEGSEAGDPEPASPKNAALGKSVEGLTASVQALQQLVQTIQKRSDEQMSLLRKAHGVSNAMTVDGDRPPHDGGEVSWPMDMNRPISRDNVKKETSFYD